MMIAVLRWTSDALVRRDVTRHPVAITIRHANTLKASGSTKVATMKRSREEESHDEHPAKVRRLSRPDRLSRLSDELLVRILSFVPVPSLLVCQR